MEYLIESALKIKGWMSTLELQFLAERAMEADLIVEFGCYMGRSTRALGENTRGVVHAVDTWDTEYPDQHGNNTGIVRDNSFLTFKENLKDLIGSGKVKPWVGKSIYFNLKEKADFIFLDADHRYEAVRDDIVKAKSLLKEGGIIAGHDYNHDDWPGVKQAVDEAFPTAELTDSIWCVKL